MIFLVFFLFNFELKAPTTEFIYHDGKRISLFPLGIEIYEKDIKILANYAEFDPQEKIFFLKDSVKIFMNRDTCYTNLAIYNLKTKIWEMPKRVYLVANLKDKGRIIINGDNSQYNLEKEILYLEKGEIKLKEKIKFLGKKIEVDNKNNFLYSYLETKIMNYDEKESLINSLDCDTLFYDFKNDTGWVKGNVNYNDSLGKIRGKEASFVLEEEVLKEVIFRNNVFLTFQREESKVELECRKAKFLFDNNDLKIAYGEDILLGKTYLKKK